MDDATKQKLRQMISQEIEVEDDMLGLYSVFLKEDFIIGKMAAGDKEIVLGIIENLLADTARHKKTMAKLAANL